MSFASRPSLRPAGPYTARCCRSMCWLLCSRECAYQSSSCRGSKSHQTVLGTRSSHVLSTLTSYLDVCSICMKSSRSSRDVYVAVAQSEFHLSCIAKLGVRSSQAISTVHSAPFDHPHIHEDVISPTYTTLAASTLRTWSVVKVCSCHGNSQVHSHGMLPVLVDHLNS